jgi:hypothetical protein
MNSSVRLRDVIAVSAILAVAFGDVALAQTTYRHSPQQPQRERAARPRPMT